MELQKIQTVTPTLLRVSDSVTLESGVIIPVLSGRVSRSEVASEKGYRYRKGFWPTIINDDRVQNKIKSREMLGCIEHPTDDLAYMNTPYTEASHIVLEAWIENDEPYAKFGILNNEKGCGIKALMDVGHRPGVSTRALGSYETDSVGKYVPENNFGLITWDVVNTPNFPDAKVEKVSDSLKESAIFKEVVQMYQLRDSVDEHYNAETLARQLYTAREALKKSLTIKL